MTLKTALKMTLKAQLGAAAHDTKLAADHLWVTVDQLRRQTLTAQALVGSASGDDARGLLAALQIADRHLEAAAHSLGAAQRRIEEFIRNL